MGFRSVRVVSGHMVTGHENDRHASIRIGRYLTFTHGSSDFFLCLLKSVKARGLIDFSLLFIVFSFFNKHLLTGFVMDMKPQITWFVEKSCTIPFLTNQT